MKAGFANVNSTSFYQEVLLVAKVHLAEYLAKPLLNLGFIVSLAIATSTLLSILVLNHASEQQYQTANNRLKTPIAFMVVPEQGKHISIDDFGQLRAAGFHQLNGVHLFDKALKKGNYITLRAMDILPLVVIEPNNFSSEKINISQRYAEELGLKTHSSLTLTSGAELALQTNDINDWGKVALLDISLAWQLFPEIKGFSHLVVSSMSSTDKSRLANILPAHLSIQDTWSIEEREGFADALHLNLSALAVLGFIVSLFIAYQAASQAWAKRTELAAKLRLLGVSLNAIQVVMMVEAFCLTLLASLLGIGIATLLVSLLLPILGLTLEQLYQLRLTGHFQWNWQYNSWAFAISALAVTLALVKPFKTISTAHVALSARTRVQVFHSRFNLWLTCVLLGFFALWPDNNWFQLMFKYGLLLLASVTFLPSFLTGVLHVLAKLSRSFRLAFIFKDAKQQVARRYLPIAAFYLALTSSIAAALMVSSFESSFVAYLNQLLNSDMFISYNVKQKKHIETWLKQQEDIDEYILFKKSVAKLPQEENEQAETVALYDLVSSKQLSSLSFKKRWQTENASPTQAENHCYINEQLAYQQKVIAPQSLVLVQGNKRVSCWVQGIYYDYGNQGFAVKVQYFGGNTQENSLSGWKEIGFSLFLKPESKITKQTIIQALSLDEQQVYEPEQIKALALKVFEQTFVLTQAIAFVLLSIACFGLFLSANSLWCFSCSSKAESPQFPS